MIDSGDYHCKLVNRKYSLSRPSSGYLIQCMGYHEQQVQAFVLGMTLNCIHISLSLV